MKKQLIRLSLMVMPALALISSCSKDEDNKNERATLGQTTITGKATADLILNNGQLENVPAGTVILATISTRDLVLNETPGATYATKTYTATVDGSGNYTLNIEAGTKPVTVTITPNPFTFDQVLENGTTRSTMYTFPGATVVVSGTAGRSQVRNLAYAANEVPGSKMGLITYQFDSVVYFNDLCEDDPADRYTFVPNGTIVVASWINDNGDSQERELVVNNGKISLVVETSRSGNLSVTFRGRKFYGALNHDVAGDCETENDHAYTAFSVTEGGIKGELTKVTDKLEFH
jgi:hypothetical protein